MESSGDDYEQGTLEGTTPIDNEDSGSAFQKYVEITNKIRQVKQKRNLPLSDLGLYSQNRPEEDSEVVGGTAFTNALNQQRMEQRQTQNNRRSSSTSSSSISSSSISRNSSKGNKNNNRTKANRGTSTSAKIVEVVVVVVEAIVVVVVHQ